MKSFLSFIYEHWNLEKYKGKRDTAKRIFSHYFKKIDGHDVRLDINSDSGSRDFAANFMVNGDYEQQHLPVQT